MSARGTYLDGDRVFLDDAHGHHTHVPARVAHLMLQTAKNDDDGRAVWALRPFDRDVLQGAVDLIDAQFCDDCDNCHDRPGTEDMGDGHTFCPACCSAAAGSHYDDRIEH